MEWTFWLVQYMKLPLHMRFCSGLRVSELVTSIWDLLLLDQISTWLKFPAASGKLDKGWIVP